MTSSLDFDLYTHYIVTAVLLAMVLNVIAGQCLSLIKPALTAPSLLLGVKKRYKNCNKYM